MLDGSDNAVSNTPNPVSTAYPRTLGIYLVHDFCLIPMPKLHLYSQIDV